MRIVYTQAAALGLSLLCNYNSQEKPFSCSESLLGSPQRAEAPAKLFTAGTAS